MIAGAIAGLRLKAGNAGSWTWPLAIGTCLITAGPSKMQRSQGPSRRFTRGAVSLVGKKEHPGSTVRGEGFDYDSSIPLEAICLKPGETVLLENIIREIGRAHV